MQEWKDTGMEKGNYRKDNLQGKEDQGIKYADVAVRLRSVAMGSVHA